MKNKNDLQAKIDQNQRTASQAKRRTRGQTYINNSKFIDMAGNKPEATPKNVSRLELSPKKKATFKAFLQPEAQVHDGADLTKFTSNPLIRNPAPKKSTTKLSSAGEIAPEDRDRVLHQLTSHAESINSRMGDLLKRSERLNDNAKRLSGQIDSILRE